MGTETLPMTRTSQHLSGEQRIVSAISHEKAWPKDRAWCSADVCEDSEVYECSVRDREDKARMHYIRSICSSQLCSCENCKVHSFRVQWDAGIHLETAMLWLTQDIACSAALFRRL